MNVENPMVLPKHERAPEPIATDFIGNDIYGGTYWEFPDGDVVTDINLLNYLQKQLDVTQTTLWSVDKWGDPTEEDAWYFKGDNEIVSDDMLEDYLTKSIGVLKNRA